MTTTFYLRSAEAPTPATLPTGFLGTWGQASTLFGSAGGMLDDLNSGSSQLAISPTWASIAKNTSQNLGHFQYISRTLDAQTVGPSVWTPAFAGKLSNAGSTHTWGAVVSVFLVNGSTGAIRTTLVNAQGVGTGSRTSTSELTCLSSGISSASGTATAGDYLVLEVALLISNTANSAFTPTSTVYDSGATAIGSDAAAASDAKSLITCSLTLTFQATSYSRSVTDAPTSSEARTTAFTGTRTLTEAISSSESRTSVTNHPRAVTDSSTTAESLARLGVFSRSLVDPTPATTVFQACAGGTGDLLFWPSTAGAVTVDTTTNRLAGDYGVYKLSTSSPAASARLTLTNVMADAGRRCSFWAMFPSVSPAADGSFLLVENSSGTGIINIILRTTGRLRINPVGATVVDGTTVLTANVFYRLALAYTITNSTTFEIRLYLNGRLEATASSNGTLTNTGTNRFDLSLATGYGANFLLYANEFYSDDGTDLNDPGNLGVTAKRPISNNVNSFDTAIGANPANRWTNVNERPLSTTNGWEQLATTQVQENYGLETAAAGDVDISGAQIVSRTAWMWAKATTAGSGTPALIDNGTVVPVTLTTSAALYTNITDGSNYPSNAAGIGMRSNGASAGTFLYECGTIITYRYSSSESLTRVVGKVAAITDTPQSAEAVSRSGTYSRAAAESAQTVESLVRSFTGLRGPLDTPQIVELLSVASVLSRSSTDSPQSSDTAARTAVGARSTVESVQSAESASRSQVLFRSSGDTTDVGETLTSTAAHVREQVESVTSLDSAARAAVLARDISITAQSSEQTARALVMHRESDDTCDTAEDIQASTSLISKQVADAATILESVTRLGIFSRTDTLDFVSVSEQITRLCYLARDLLDAPVTVDSVTRLLSRIRAVDDSPATAELLIRVFDGSRSPHDLLITRELVTASTGPLPPPSVIAGPLFGPGGRRRRRQDELRGLQRKRDIEALIVWMVTNGWI